MAITMVMVMVMVIGEFNFKKIQATLARVMSTWHEKAGYA